MVRFGSVQFSSVLVLFLLISACDPANLDAAGVLTLVGSTAERSYLVPDRVTIGGNARVMQPTTGNVQAVRYSLGGQRRPYLLSGDLAAGITGGNTLHLPMLAAATCSARSTSPPSTHRSGRGSGSTTPGCARSWSGGHPTSGSAR